MRQKQIIINNLLRNYVIQENTGAKQTLVFLHGRGQSHKSFDVLAKNFSEYNIIIPDFPGFGASQIPKTERTVHDYAQQLSDFLKKLGISSATFIIHSFGGRVLIDLYQLKTIHIEKIVFIASGGFRPPITTKAKIFLFLKSIADSLGLTNFIYNTSLEKYVQLVFASRDYAHAKGIMKKIVKHAVNYDQSNILHTIQVPSLLIRGEKDEETPISDAHYFHEKIKGSILEIQPGGTHFVFQEYPEWTQNLIHTFLHDHP